MKKTKQFIFGDSSLVKGAIFVLIWKCYLKDKYGHGWFWFWTLSTGMALVQPRANCGPQATYDPFGHFMWTFLSFLIAPRISCGKYYLLKVSLFGLILTYSFYIPRDFQWFCRLFPYSSLFLQISDGVASAENTTPPDDEP